MDAMLDQYALNVTNPDAPLKPSLAEWQERYTWLDRLRIADCLIRLGHSYGSQVRYTGTANHGTGYRVCSRCGYKRKYSLVRPGN